jgi:hypothetical protein
MDRWYLNAWQHRSSGKLIHGSGCWQGRREDIWSGTGNGFENVRKALAVVEDALRAKDGNAGADFVRTHALILWHKVWSFLCKHESSCEKRHWQRRPGHHLSSDLDLYRLERSPASGPVKVPSDCFLRKSRDKKTAAAVATNLDHLQKVAVQTT